MGANELEAVIEAARKEALELRQNLRDIEKARLDAHHGRHELRHRLGSHDESEWRATTNAAKRGSWSAASEVGRWSPTVLRRSSALCILRTRRGARQHERLVGWLLFRLRRSTC